MTTKIRDYRRRAGMKQADLAQAVGVRRETIGNLERGRYNPSLRLAHHISKVLKAPIDVLFSFEDED